MEKPGKPTKHTHTHTHRKKEYRTGTDETVAREGRCRNVRMEIKGKIKGRQEIARHNNGDTEEINPRRNEEEGGSRE